MKKVQIWIIHGKMYINKTVFFILMLKKQVNKTSVITFN